MKPHDLDTDELFLARRLVMGRAHDPSDGIVLDERATVVVETWPRGDDEKPVCDRFHVDTWDRLSRRYLGLCEARQIRYHVWDGRELFE